MGYKFTNFAITTLTRDMSASDTTMFVADNTPFPDLVTPDLARLVVVGACNSAAEVMDISGKCSGCLTISARALEGTSATAFKKGDHVVLDLTAAFAQSFYDTWSWYLGPYCPAPATDDRGEPVQEGMVYYDTCVNMFFVWNGSQWTNLHTPAPTVAAAYTYLDNTGDQTAPFNLPQTDIYGNVMQDIYQGQHLVELFHNGVRQPENVDSSIMQGEFQVDWALNRITMLQDVLQGALIEVIIHHIATRDELILRTRAHDSGYSLAYG